MTARKTIRSAVAVVVGLTLVWVLGRELAESRGIAAVSSVTQVETDAAPDVVPEALRTLDLATLDAATGEPLADVTLEWSPEGEAGAGSRGTTDAGGLLRVSPAPEVVRIEARKEGWVYDYGREPGSTRRRRSAWHLGPGCTRVEVLLSRVATLRGTVSNAASGEPADDARVEVELFGSDGSCRTVPVELDRAGRFGLPIPSAAEGIAVRSVVVRASGSGYEPAEPARVDLTASPGNELISLQLRPRAGARRVRGRVLSGSQPVPDLLLTAGTFSPGLGRAPAFEPFWSARTGSDGGFDFTRVPRSPHEVLAIRSRDGSASAFCCAGPLTLDEAASGELSLHLEPEIAVPAVVEGLTPGARYAFHVWLADTDLEIHMGGQDLGEIENASVLETELRLPARRRSRVTIGLRHASGERLEWSAPVYHDPLHPYLPLKLFAAPTVELRGFARGLSAGQLETVVARVRANDGDSPLTTPGASAPLSADGGFRFVGLPPGDYLLELCEHVPGAADRSLARQAIDLHAPQAAVDSVEILAAEPALDAEGQDRALDPER